MEIAWDQVGFWWRVENKRVAIMIAVNFSWDMNVIDRCVCVCA